MSPYREHVHAFVIQRYAPLPYCTPIRYCECGLFPPSPLWMRALLWLCG